MIINGEPTYSDLNKPLGLNIGNDYTLFSGLYLIGTSVRFTDTTDINTESSWLTKIKDKDIIVIDNILSVDPLTEQSTLQKSLLDFSYIAKPGKYIYRLNYDWDYEYYQKVEELSGQRFDVIFVDYNANIYARQNGSAISGFTARILVEKPLMGTGEANLSNVYIELEDPDEIKEAVTIESDLYFDGLFFLYVTISEVYTHSASTLWFVVTDSIYGCPIGGIEIASITITDITNGVLTISELTYTSEGLYKATLSGQPTSGDIVIDSDRYSGQKTYAFSGESWIETNSILSPSLNESIFVDGANDVYFLNYKSVYKSSNAMLSKALLYDYSPLALLNMAFGGSTNVYIILDNLILATTKTGTLLGSKAGTYSGLNKAFFISDTVGWVVGDGGYIGKSTGALTALTTQVSDTTENLFGVFALDANNVLVVGANGTILRTTDGGANWSDKTVATSDRFNSVYSLSASYSVACGNNGIIYKTTNGGNTWTDISFSSPDLQYSYFDAIMINSSVIYCFGGTTISYIIKTVDGGANWTIQPADDVGALKEAAFYDANTMYCISIRGQVLKFNN